MRNAKWLSFVGALVLGIGLGVAQSRAEQKQSGPKTQQVQDDHQAAPMECGKTGTPCQGGSDCCYGWDCPDPGGGKPRTCQPNK